MKIFNSNFKKFVYKTYLNSYIKKIEKLNCKITFRKPSINYYKYYQYIHTICRKTKVSIY